MSIAAACFFCVLLTLLVTRTTAQATWATEPFPAFALPLAVRSPYLNSWLTQGAEAAPCSALWPQAWPLNHVVGWSANVQVDNVAYNIFGDPATQSPGKASQTTAEFTPTRTSFLLQTGPVSVNLTILSPIEPTDLLRQSIPFSYFYIDIASTDGHAHDVKVYSDISAEWISGDNTLIANWSSNTNGSFISLQTQLESPAPFAEIDGIAQDAVAYFAMSNSQQLNSSWQIGQDTIVRSLFINNGSLLNQSNNTFRAINLNFTVFGLSADLGSITSTNSPVVWAIGILRDPVIQYTAWNDQVELRRSYFWSQFSTPQDVIGFFLDDFERALSAAVAFDAQIQNDGSKFSAQYASILSLSVRQVLASMDITLPEEVGGNWNTSDVKLFMKNIGSNSDNTGGANTADVLYASFPVFLYLNPALGGYLLAPLLEYQETSLYTNSYAAIDLGIYPNATGNNGPHNLAVEESANMLIMTLAHAQASGNDTLISKHYHLLRGWAEYLVENTLDPPSNQLTADGFTATNHTNLVIKGIIGIGAMAQISELAGNGNDSSKYKNTSVSYVQQWETLALSSDNSRLLADYGIPSSSGLIYNLFADKLLQLNLVPETVYETQTAFYASEAGQYLVGLPLDSEDLNTTRTDSMMLTASTASNASIRNQFVSLVSAYAVSNANHAPFPVIYNPSSGLLIGGTNSPAQGAVFSLLVSNSTTNSSGTSSTSSSDSPNPAQHSASVGDIVGGVIGGIVFIGIVGFLFFFLRRLRQRQAMSSNHRKSVPRNGDVEPFVIPDGGSPSTMSTSTGILQTVAEGKASVGVPLEVKSGRHGPQGPQIRLSNALSSETLPRVQRRRQGRSSASGSTSTDASPRTTSSQMRIAQQSLANEQLRTEVENLRLEMERIRLERQLAGEEAPPVYALGEG